MYADPIVEKIVQARVNLLMNVAFFGNLATRLRLSKADDWCQTVATDGRNFYYNSEFIEKLSTKEIEFAVCHEILHIAFDHFGRLDGRNPKIFNIAADYAINGQLVRDRIGKVPTSINIFHDEKYYGKSAEEIYDILYQQFDEDELDQLGKLLDEHIDWEQPGENGQGSGGSGQEGNGRPSYSKEELRQIRDEMREAMIQAAQVSGAGRVPAEIARLIKTTTEPKMNWRQILRQQIQSIIRSDYSFLRPNRKGWHLSAILPGSDFDMAIDVCVCIDMSGSISDRQAADFLGEVKGIMEEFRDFNLKLWTFDTKVYGETSFTPYTLDEINDYHPQGGGGTDFEANWEYMKQHNIVPKKLICFTDGLPCGSWGDDSYCDTLFVIHGSETIVPPFGEYAYYEFKHEK